MFKVYERDRRDFHASFIIGMTCIIIITLLCINNNTLYLSGLTKTLYIIKNEVNVEDAKLIRRGEVINGVEGV